MAIIPENAYLKRSGQLWKLTLSLGLLVLGGLLIFTGLIIADKDNKDLFVILVLIGVAVGITALIWEATSIRCKDCGISLGWMALNGKWSFVSDKCCSCANIKL